MRRTKWNVRWPEIRRLLLDEGLTAAAVAERMGTTRQQITRVLRRHGTRLDPMRHWLARRGEIEAMRERGARRREIAAHFGVGENTVSQVLSILGLNINKRPNRWSEKNRQYALEARRRGLTSGQVAMRVGHTPEQVRSLWQRADLHP